MRILAVEDEPEIARLIKNSLQKSGHVVDVVGDGKEAEERVDIYDYDVIILDVMLPGADGFEVCNYIRDAGIDSKIIMLTARGDIGSKVKGLNLGADDYLVKPFSFAELEARIRAMARRTKKLTKDKLRVGPLTLDTAQKRASLNGRPLVLTPMEFRLLEYLMRHKDEVCTRTMLGENVWGDKPNASNVIDATLSKLRGKIRKINGGKDLIRSVPKSGYRIY